MNKLLTLALIALPAAIPSLAHADDAKNAVADVSNFGGQLSVDEWSPSVLTTANKQPQHCFDKVAKAKKAGLKADDPVVGDFGKHANAKPNGYKFEIKFSELPWICEEYERQFKAQTAIIPIRAAAEFLSIRNNPPTEKDAAGYSKGSGAGTAELGRKCLKTVDAVIADGVDGGMQIKVRDKTLSLSEAAKTYCQAEIDYGEAFEALVVKAQDAKHDTIAKKYTDLGVGGDRLELFIEYDDVYWYGKGCHVVDDIKDVVKAKKLFHWLENSDGTITIRTYTFKGNTYKSKDKKYKTEAKAYKGCK